MNTVKNLLSEINPKTRCSNNRFFGQFERLYFTESLFIT